MFCYKCIYKGGTVFTNILGTTFRVQTTFGEQFFGTTYSLVAFKWQTQVLLFLCCRALFQFFSHGNCIRMIFFNFDFTNVFDIIFGHFVGWKVWVLLSLFVNRSTPALFPHHSCLVDRLSSNKLVDRFCRYRLSIRTTNFYSNLVQQSKLKKKIIKIISQLLIVSTIQKSIPSNSSLKLQAFYYLNCVHNFSLYSKSIFKYGLTFDMSSLWSCRSSIISVFFLLFCIMPFGQLLFNNGLKLAETSLLGFTVKRNNFSFFVK